MSNAKPNRPNRREEALAELKRSQARAKRRRTLGAVGIVTAIVLVLAGLVTYSIVHTRSSGSAETTAAAPAVIKAATGVPAGVFDTVGVGSSSSAPKAIDAPALTEDGKPKVLYVGAEYCPYCAAERWSVVAALSRFGTFSGLGQTTSSGQDVYPNTATLSFHGSSYTSKYLAFTGIETETNQIQGSGYAPLDKLTGDDATIFSKYDAPPYVSGTAGSIPFIDLGGSYVSSGASYDPGIFKDKTHLEIAQALSDPTSDIAKAVDGTANVFSAQLCQLTKGQPTSVCQSSGVLAAAAKLPTSTSTSSGSSTTAPQ